MRPPSTPVIQAASPKAAKALTELTLTIAGLFGAGAQVRNCSPTASDLYEQVELDHRDPHLVGRLLECAVVCVAAGHVDQDVDPTEAGDCIGEGSLDWTGATIRAAATPGRLLRQSASSR
jgi:hypothetical protein